ncbi:Leucine rich repeat containing 14B, partial [Podarcis lilfordi]
MHSLRFLSAGALVSNTELIKGNLGSVAHNLFPLLFKASYLQEQGEVLHDLVANWPLKELNIGKLLGKTIDHQEDISSRVCSVCLTSCLTGLRDYVLNCSSPYAKRLKVVDLTGLKDVEVQLCNCRKTMGRWARTELLSKICYDLLVEMQRLKFNPDVFEISVDVLTDVFVTERNYELLVQALLMRCHCPLKIRCASFRVDNLALRKLFYIIKLTDPSSLLKFEIVHNVRLEMEHLHMLLNNVHFPQLTSLTLPARTFDVRRFTPEDEAILVGIGEKLSQMTQLTELSLAFSTLTGRIRKLLSSKTLLVLDSGSCNVNTKSSANALNFQNSLFSTSFKGCTNHSLKDLYLSRFFWAFLVTSSSLNKVSFILHLKEPVGVSLISIFTALSSEQVLDKFPLFLSLISTKSKLSVISKRFSISPHLSFVNHPIQKVFSSSEISHPVPKVCKFLHKKVSQIVFLKFRQYRPVVLKLPMYRCYFRGGAIEIGSVLLRRSGDPLENHT